MAGVSRQLLAGLVGATGGVLLTKLSNRPDITYQEPPVAKEVKENMSKTTSTEGVEEAGLRGRAREILAWGSPRPLVPGPLVYTNHVLEWDAGRRVPRWVAEHLTARPGQEEVASRRGVQFRPDPHLPPHLSSSNKAHTSEMPMSFKNNVKYFDTMILLSKSVGEEHNTYWLQAIAIGDCGARTTGVPAGAEDTWHRQATTSTARTP